MKSLKPIENIFYKTSEGLKLKQATEWLARRCEVLYDKGIELEDNAEFQVHLKRFEEQVQIPAEKKWQELLIIYKIK